MILGANCVKLCVEVYMLQEEAQLIYDILTEITGGSDVYKIVDADEIMEKLPEGVSFTTVQLSQIIKDLKDREYLDIKYFTPDEYCLHVIKKIEVQPNVSLEMPASLEQNDVLKPSQDRQLYEAPAKPKEKNVNRGLLFFLSFLGSLLGSGVVAAITAVIIKFVL